MSMSSALAILAWSLPNPVYPLTITLARGEVWLRKTIIIIFFMRSHAPPRRRWLCLETHYQQIYFNRGYVHAWHHFIIPSHEIQ